MNENSRRVLDELERRKIPLMKLGVPLGMFEFQIKKKLEQGLTDEETKQLLTIVEEVKNK
jgi:hypothetical protein